MNSPKLPNALGPENYCSLRSLRLCVNFTLPVVSPVVSVNSTTDKFTLYSSRFTFYGH